MSIEGEVFCVLFCEEEEREESSRVLESIQEETSKVKVCFLVVFFQSFFLFFFFFFIFCFLFFFLVEGALEDPSSSLDFWGKKRLSSSLTVFLPSLKYFWCQE
jgi:hypothetical protein